METNEDASFLPSFSFFVYDKTTKMAKSCVSLRRMEEDHREDLSLTFEDASKVAMHSSPIDAFRDG